MNNLITELEEAAQSSPSGTCKICAYLAAVDPDDSIKVDNLIRAKDGDKNKISADRVAAILKNYGASVGSTTVRRHRTTCPPFLPIRQA